MRKLVGQSEDRGAGVGFGDGFTCERTARAHEVELKIDMFGGDCLQISRRPSRRPFRSGSGLRKHHIWPNKWNAFYYYRMPPALKIFAPRNRAPHTFTCSPHVYNVVLTQQIAQSTSRLRPWLWCLSCRCAGARGRCAPQSLTRLLLGQIAHGDLLCWRPRLLGCGASKKGGKGVSTRLLGCRGTNLAAWRHDRCRGCRLRCAHVDRGKVVGASRLVACWLLRTHDGRGNHPVRCGWR
jgi:hypothetical protein